MPESGGQIGGSDLDIAHRLGEHGARIDGLEAEQVRARKDSADEFRELRRMLEGMQVSMRAPPSQQSDPALSQAVLAMHSAGESIRALIATMKTPPAHMPPPSSEMRQLMDDVLRELRAGLHAKKTEGPHWLSMIGLVALGGFGVWAMFAVRGVAGLIFGG